MKVTLLVDIGSTNTKIAAVDLENETVIGRSYAPSTVSTDMTTGLMDAYRRLLAQTGTAEMEVEKKLACSSAAGGLRLVAIGLVPSLTTEAARMAALGAGAKVVGVYSHHLSRQETAKIEATRPDIILLAGGTDGGNSQVILKNAEMLAATGLACPILVCGNKAAAEEAAKCLTVAGKTVQVTDNVLPELGELNVEPCGSVIREVFIKRIVRGKGLDKAQEFLGSILMPTPLAVLKAALLLAQGTPGEPGLGELMVVDIGGATTNVLSMAEGRPSRAGVLEKGLPEPFAKRTVEGDLGLRYNAQSILDLAGRKQLLEDMSIRGSPAPPVDLEARVRHLSSHIEAIPQSREAALVDVALARSAVRIATQRHAGTLTPMYTATGQISIQHGKDLTRLKRVIGTGGVLAYGIEPEWVLEAARYSEKNPTSLRPENPEFLLDTRYLLYAVGLLSEVAPEKALRIARKNLRPV